MGSLRRRFVVLSLCGSLAASVSAHGPAREKVELDIEINAPAAAVWARVGNFQDMSWHPAVASTRGEGGNAPEATRVLTLQGDGKATIEEMLKRHDAEGMTYAYKITNVDVKVLPVTNYASSISVESIGEGRSKLIWRGAFYRGFPSNDPPPELNDEAAIKAVTGMYKGGLEGLKAEMEKAGK